jgi:carbonic anhydrase
MLPLISRRTVFLSAAWVVALATGCSSVSRTASTKKDLFSDPSRFESLASSAQENPSGPPPPPAAAPAAPTAPTHSNDLMSGLSAGIATPDAPKSAWELKSSVEADLGRVPAMAVVSSTTDDSLSPDAAYSTIVRGNERFVMGMTKGEHRDIDRRRALASAQHPHTIVLSCSDSRVPPELIFDQGLGDLFTIRVAGNVLGSAQVASIEYAVEHLGSKLIVVMGHESCGAVKAALAAKGEHGKTASAGSTDLDWLVSSIQPNLAGRGIASVDSSTDPKLRKPVMANVDAVTDQLLLRSKILSHAMEKGQLKVVRGIYSLDTGKVDFWGMK